MKYDLIAEAYVTLLIEGRIDDLKLQNPHLVNEIDSYVNQDPTPTKKFVPWLVSQHKRGNVTPTDNISLITSNFDRYKNQLPKKDHSQYTFQELHDHLNRLQGTAATKREKAQQTVHKGIETIYDDGNISAHYIKTKEASQEVYGGGKELGGLHTPWCVSARGNKCMYGDYGRMYTVHVKDDPKSPYAVHPEKNTITNKNNKGDIEIETFLKRNKKLFPILSDIRTHYAKEEKTKQLLINNSDNIDKHELTNIINNGSNDLKELALSHKNITPDHIDMVLNNSDINLRKIAARSNKATPNQIEKFLNDPDDRVIAQVATNPNITDKQLEHLYNSTNFPHIKAAIAKHEKTPPHILDRAIDDSSIAEHAAKNPNTPPNSLSRLLTRIQGDDYYQLKYARMNAAFNPSTPLDSVRNALSDPDPDVRFMAKVRLENEIR